MGRVEVIVRRVVLGTFAAAAVVCGGGKHPQGAPLRALRLNEGESMAQVDIARGYRLAAETTEAVSYTMPENAVIVGNWHKRGTFGEWMRYELGWEFPLGSNDAVYSAFAVFNDGKIRPTPRDQSHEICAVGVPMLAMQGASRFWVASAARTNAAHPSSDFASQSSSLRSSGDTSQVTLTWENFYLNADTNAPVNAQIVLCESGDFVTRSNVVARYYARIDPHDWDGDGLANEIDAEPYTNNGDCFGTSAEWYNANCGGVLSAATNAAGEIEIGWRTNANPAAYYWLEFAATKDRTRVAVTCDGASDLGDMVVIARTNQMCRVPLLVGATYAVRASAPLAGIETSDGNANITFNDNIQVSATHSVNAPYRAVAWGRASADFDVCSPLEFVIASYDDGRYGLAVSPTDPGVALLGVSGGCCTNVVSTNGFSWVCTADCGCGAGEHTLYATASWEGYVRLFVWTGSCPCHDGGRDSDTGVRLSLSVPDTLFANRDHDVVDGELDDDFCHPSLADDDLAEGVVSLAVGAGGTVTFEEPQRIGCEVYEAVPGTFPTEFSPISMGADWPVGDGAGLAKRIYVDAAAVSANYNQARVSVRWTGAGGFAETVARRLTVAHPTAEPICSATTNVVENGEARELTVNPCGVGVGRDAYFRIDVLPRDYPDEKIVWTSTEEGRVAFVGGNRGRAVTVRGVSPGATRLGVQIGECPSDPPWFPLHVVTNRILHMTAWITRDKFGTLICSTNEVSAMLPTVNDVMAQVGVSVVLDDIVLMEEANSASVYYDATNAVEVAWSRQRLLETAAGVEGLHCFFVDDFVERAHKGTLAVWTQDKGIVMTREATALTLAHEIGHELGADDIYIDRDTQNVRNVPFQMAHAPQDWSNGCGRLCSGYYRSGTKLEAIIGRMLMNGEEDPGRAQGRDMTTGPVYGVCKAGDGGYAVGLVAVGFFDVFSGNAEEEQDE